MKKCIGLVLLMNNDTILLVFEGEKTEPQIYKSIEKLFFSSKKSSVLRASYKSDIYQLWSTIKDDEYIDIVEIIREKNKDVLDGVKRSDVSQVYLFFDHDIHSRGQKIESANEAIKGMLELFNNETENGKLYISYPMVEALKDCNADETFCVERCCIDIKLNTNYKQIVGSRSNFTQIEKYSIDTWHLIIRSNIKKANCIVNDVYEIPLYNSVIDDLTQLSIHDNQVSKFILTRKSVAIISSFPMFLIEYYGKQLYDILFNA